jgi:predicted nucleic acid-binding protein
MKIYIFDSSALMHLFDYYYESRFPTLWKKFYQSVESGHVVSVREVRNEIDGHHNKERRINQWAKQNTELFTTPTLEEMRFVQEIFKVEHFQVIISRKNLLSGMPVADPFVIAKAKIIDGTVVTNEANKPHGAKIPNICGYFNVKCMDLEKFMEVEDWRF